MGGLEKIEATSIDLFAEDRVDRVDLIKLDIEGSELEAIQGSRNVLQKYQPNLAICTYHKPSHMYEIYDLVTSICPEYQVGFGHYSPSIIESVMYFSAHDFACGAAKYHNRSN